MDWIKLINLLPVLLQAVDVAQNIGNDRKAGSNLSVLDTIKKEAPAVVGIFQQVGAALFPNVPPAQQSSAAAVALDVDGVKRIQATLNGNLRDEALRLVVDGQYGSKTKAAVTAFQSTHGLVVDGWAGPLTQKALGIA